MKMSGGSGIDGYRDPSSLSRASEPLMRVEPLTSSERSEALKVVEKLRDRILMKHSNAAKAFKAIDVDGDESLSYEEFGKLVSTWMPSLSFVQIDRACRLLDKVLPLEHPLSTP